MATLVLTAVGSAVGGPLGSAIGAFVGQQIDRALIGNGPRREGPRLKELEVQTSSYGTAIPAIFGAMRVAGTVIWASDLIEKKLVTGGSKSQPGTATYSYSVNLAVAISSRPITRIGRIWADGNLLRGAAGDLKFETELRIHNGEGDQPVDPLLASSEAPDLSPAYRGLAYAVFEGLQLAEFGNRIPSLTFEVFEREDAVPLHVIVNDVSGHLIAGTTSETLGGYAVQGRDIRASIEPLISVFPVTLRPKADGLELNDWFDVPKAILPGNTETMINRKSIERLSRVRSARAHGGASIALRYYEKGRDYQAGLQRYGANLNDNHETQYELPACLDTAQAQRLTALNWLQQSRSQSTSAGFFPYGDIPPRIAEIQFDSEEKITEIEYFNGYFRVSSQGWVETDRGSFTLGDPGRDVSSPDLAVGHTLLHLIDLPAVSEPLPSQPVIGVVAAGTGEGWRKAALGYRDGLALIELGRTAPAGVIGLLQADLPPHAGHLLDTSNNLMVRVLHSGMDFPPGFGDPLHPNAPLIHIAGELIKYGDCEQLGPTDFRFARLARGCFGSEIAQHPTGTALCLVSEATTLRFGGLGLAIDDSASFEAVGIGDSNPVLESIPAVGRAIRPLAPCHLNVAFDEEQNLHISWFRRSRWDTGWRDFADLSVDEPSLMFEVEIKSSQVLLAQFQLSVEYIEVSAALVGSWGLQTGVPITVDVRQRGTYALSWPTSQTVLAR